MIGLMLPREQQHRSSRKALMSVLIIVFVFRVATEFDFLNECAVAKHDPEADAAISINSSLTSRES